MPRNNDAPQTAPDSPIPPGSIFIPVTDGTIAPPVSRSVARRSEQFVRAQLNLLDRNNDGFLSRDELNQLLPLQGLAARLVNPVIADLNAYNASVSNLPTLRREGVVLDNIVLADTGTITEIYTNNPQTPGLLPASIARIVRDVLPRGVETIRLSDEVNHAGSNVQAIPLPNNKMLLSGPAGPAI